MEPYQEEEKPENVGVGNPMHDWTEMIDELGWMCKKCGMKATIEETEVFKRLVFCPRKKGNGKK